VTSSSTTDADNLIEGLLAFIKSEVVRRHDAYADLLWEPAALYDEAGRYVPEVQRLITEVRQASAESGFYAMFAPTSVGGGGLSMETFYRCWEAIFTECGAKYWLGHDVLAHWTKGPSFLLELMGDRVRKSILPGLMSGTETLCFAMSEPDAGSDARRMRTSATPTARGWRINGTKQWISNAPYASHAIVFAVTNIEMAKRRSGGISAFVVPADHPNFQVTKVIKMFGSPGGDESIITLDDIEVPKEALVGTFNEGFNVALKGVGLGRLYNSAKAVGLTRWALREAVSYAKTRTAFGNTLSHYQGVTFPMADIAMDMHAASLMGIDCGRRLDVDPDAHLELAMTKAFCTERAADALNKIMQIHGAMGFTNELFIADAWERVRKVCVADGATEVLKRQVARHMFSRDARTGQGVTA
jgi:acyl-CoA dehydrogenase